MKEITIIEGYKQVKLHYVFASTFGVLWLMLEPLGLFQILSEEFKRAGIYGYLSLLVVSFVISLGYWHYKNSSEIKKYELLVFKIVITETGSSYQIKTPKFLNVKKFLILFLDHVQFVEDVKEVKTLRRLTEPYLVKFNNDTYESLDESKSLWDVGIRDKNECRIQGGIKQTNEIVDEEGNISKFYQFVERINFAYIIYAALFYSILKNLQEVVENFFSNK